MKRAQQGFTLIELMIVVAIIGILAAIALPQYQNYVTKSKWASAVNAVGQLKTAIATCTTTHNSTVGDCDTVGELQASGDLPATWSMPTLPTLSSVTLTASTGAIVLVGTSEIGTCTVTMTPTPSTNALSWGFSTSGTDCDRAKTGF